MIQQSLEQLALAHLSVEDLLDAAKAAERRSFNQYGIGIDWLRKEHRLMPPERARYCVAVFEWRIDGRWHRVRRISGPLPIAEIQQQVERHARRLGHPIITDI